MPQPKPLTTFAEAMVRTHYGRRSLQWIGDRLGCSSATVLSYAKQLGLWKPTTGEKGGTATAPAVVSPSAIRPFIPPPTREQLMAGSANLRRVYKIED
jgi:hypothetical protein